MSEPPVKKNRIRSSDLLKNSRSFGESKYDFSRIIQLKGASGRDRSKKGRPEGIASSKTNSCSSEIPAVVGCLQNQENDQLGCFGPQFYHDSENVSILTPDEIYLNLLKEKGAMFCIDDQYRTFVLKDIDISRSQLKGSQYLFISRRALSFAGEFHWVYACSCDPATMELIDCCTQQMEVTFEAFKERIPGCMHTTVLTVLLDQFDSQNMIDPSNFDNDDEMDEDTSLHNTQSNHDVITELEDGLFLIKAKKGMGIVAGTKCLTCNASVVRCVHLCIFFSIHGEQESCHDAKESHKQSCFSKMRIPFHSSVNMQETYKQSLSNRFVIENGQIILRPEVDVCDSCGLNLDEMEQSVKANVFVMNQIMDAVVSVKQCVNCDRKIYFDGLNQCVLNMGKHVICHEMLRHFMFYFLTGKTTIFTEYSVLKKTFSDSGFPDFFEKMSYQDFKEAWYAFMDLLDIDFDHSFHCPDCGPDPDTVIMDATSVAFRKELLSWKHLFSINSDRSEPYDKADSSRVKERTLFSKVVRSYLNDFTKPTKGTSKELVEKMFKIIEIENGSAEIIDLLQIIFKSSTIKGDRYFCSEPWRELVKALASSYPFCSFLPPSENFFSFLDSVFSAGKVLQDDSHLKRIQTTVPVLFRLLLQLKEKFPFKEFKACLPYFYEKVFALFLGDRCPSEDPTDEDDGLSFFPSLPKVRRRGLFVADKKKSYTKDFVCNKLSQGHPSLLPGVFTLFCPHGVCYGFQVMKFHESPDVPFTLLRTRFKKAPKLVIYDNACSLQTYCLNRDPTFFMETVFRVDGLHFKNHKACGPSFELKSYPQFAELNSQVVEQSNSRLQRVKGSLSYMTQSNFMKHCKFYLWGQNDEILSKITN